MKPFWIICALSLAAGMAEAKPPTAQCVTTCDAGYHAECVVNATPIPPTPTKTVAVPTPTKAPTQVPTAPPPTIGPPPTDVTKPSVTITAPLSGATVPAGTGTITADVSDDVGVTKVEFRIYGGLKCTKTAPPWECDAAFVAPSFTVSVTAYDAAGNQTFKENNGSVSSGTVPTPPPATAVPTAAPTAPPPTAGPAPTAPPSGGVANPPALPRASVDVTLPVPSGVTRQVQQGGNLQDALDRANPGDVVELAAGATFTGNFQAKPKAASLWSSFVGLFGATPPKIWIRSTAYTGLAPQGTRVKPADASKMAKIVTPNNQPALSFIWGAHNYYVTGIEFTGSVGSTQIVALGFDSTGNNNANSLDKLPDQVVFDRVYVHGDATRNYRRGILLNGAAGAVVDSYIDEIHEAGADSQAIAAWNAAGPHLIRNNFLSAAGENVMYGGADASVQNLTPCDLTIVGNTLYKPQSWKTSQWTIKNLFELKHSCRALVDGNVLDGIWTSAQTGYAVQMTPRNQSGSNPWANVVDTTFTRNHIKNSESGMNFLATDNNFASGTLTRMAVTNNLLEVTGRAFQVLGGNIDLSIRHNTVILPNGGGGIALYFDGSVPNQRFEYVDNMLAGNSNAVWGSGSNIPALFNKFMPGGLYTSNVIYALTDRSYIPYFPPGNMFPVDQAAVGFVNPAAGDYHLTATSPYKGKASDGTNPGAFQ